MLIISLFNQEAQPWIGKLELDERIAVAGLSAGYPNLLATGA